MSCDVPLSASFQRWKKPPGGVGDPPDGDSGTRSLPHGFTYMPEKTPAGGEHVTLRKGVPTSRVTSQRNSWIGSLWDIFALPIKAWLGPQGSLYYQPRRSLYSPSGLLDMAKQLEFPEGQSGTFRRTVSETMTTSTRAAHHLFKHSVCEVCSSFYTSNPLMYISRYSEIIVTSGYDIDTGTATTTPAMFGREALSGRRELVEQLDSEPLFDYLIQNGALERPMVDELRNEKSAAKVNLALLKHVETNGKPALNLFVNALRQTGQHHLANLLDDTQRIKALSGSGYLSQKRHKGQISLQINVRALRLPLEELAILKRPETPRKNASFRNGMGSRDWVSLDEIRYRILELTEPANVPPMPQFDIIDPSEDESKQRSCLCLCFARMFSRRKELPEPQAKSQPPKGGHGQKKGHGRNGSQNGYTPAGINGKYKPNNAYQVANGDEGESSEKEESAKEQELRNLRGLEGRFKNKAKEFFGILREQNSIMAHLSKYFEQDRGVLVLETNFELGLVIVSICMKFEQVEQLRRDYSNGKLNKDLENCLITETVLDKVGVKGIKLHTDINQDEFEMAEQELN